MADFLRSRPTFCNFSASFTFPISHYLRIRIVNVHQRIAPWTSHLRCNKAIAPRKRNSLEYHSRSLSFSGSVSFRWRTKYLFTFTLEPIRPFWFISLRNIFSWRIELTLTNAFSNDSLNSIKSFSVASRVFPS